MNIWESERTVTSGKSLDRWVQPLTETRSTTDEEIDHDHLPSHSPRHGNCRGRHAACAPPRAGRANHQDRRAERHVRTVHEHRRPDLDRLRQAGAGGFRRRRQGPQRRGDQRRSPEQARPRRVDRAPVVRPRRRGHAARRADVVGCARRAVGRDGEEQGVPQLRRRFVGSDRQVVLAQLHPLDLRHLHAGEVDRRSDGEGGRRFLVLPHRRLRVRQAVAGRYHRAGAGCRRQGARLLAVSVPRHHRFLVVPGAGAGERRQGAGPVQCRRRYGQLDQAGARIRRQPDDEGRRAADVRHRRACARAGCVAGAEPDRKLLLGPERPHASLHQSGEVEDTEQLAQHGPCRLLFRDAALPEDGRRHGRGRSEEGRRRDRCTNEEDAGRGRLLRQDHDPRGRPQSDPGVTCSR